MQMSTLTPNLAAAHDGQLSDFNWRTTMLMVIGFVLLAVLAAGARAGTTGAEFQGLYDLMFGWIQGYLARAIAIASSIAGALYGLSKQSPMLALIGIVFAVIFSVGPGVINGILTAVI